MQVQLEKMPQFLKANGQFCNWKYELQDGNQTKVPYMSGTTRKAGVNDPTTFTVFDTAASMSTAGSWASTLTVALRMANCSLGAGDRRSYQCLYGWQTERL